MGQYEANRSIWKSGLLRLRIFKTDITLYYMKIVPADLGTCGGEAKNLLQYLQSRNERMFLVMVLLPLALRGNTTYPCLCKSVIIAIRR